MTHEKRLLLREFAEWARRLGWSTHRHDAQFRGRVGDVLVEVETGVRESNLYRVVMAIHCATGLAAQVLRDAAAGSADAPLAGRLRAVLRERHAVLSIRLDPALITVRMQPGSRPSEVEIVAHEVLAAAQADAERGPYR